MKYFLASAIAALSALATVNAHAVLVYPTPRADQSGNSTDPVGRPLPMNGDLGPDGCLGAPKMKHPTHLDLLERMHLKWQINKAHPGGQGVEIKIAYDGINFEDTGYVHHPQGDTPGIYGVDVRVTRESQNAVLRWIWRADGDKDGPKEYMACADLVIKNVRGLQGNAQTRSTRRRRLLK